MLVLLVLAVLCALGVAALFQMAVFSACLFCSPDPSSAWGTRLDNVGDVDADGAEDVLLCDYEVDGSWNYLGNSWPNTRRAEHDLRVVSGRDGRVLHRSRGTSEIAYGSIGARDLGDIDGDGFGDVLLGGMRIVGRRTDFLLQARDGKEWKELWSARDWGWEVEDENEELLLVVSDSTRTIVALGSDPERLRYFDGRTGRAVREEIARSLDPVELEATSPTEALPPNADLLLGDVNGDAVPDFVNAFGYTDAAGDGQILSGADGSVLSTLHFDAPTTMFIQQPHGIGDADRDGVSDFSVPLFDYGPGQGRIVTISGATGAKLFEVVSAPTWRSAARTSIAIPDVDGDGLREVLISFDAIGLAAYSGDRLLWSSP